MGRMPRTTNFGRTDQPMAASVPLSEVLQVAVKTRQKRE